MKRFLMLSVLIALPALAATVVLDPPPGTYLGQKATIVNRQAVSVTIAGNTGVKLDAAVVLAAGESLELVWNGSNWVPPAAIFTGKVSFAFDFPVLTPAAQLGLVCASTPEFTLTGAAFNDECSLVSNLGQDGGAELDETASLSCRAKTNAVIGTVCVQKTDAGTLDLPDAGFTARVYR